MKHVHPAMFKLEHILLIFEYKTQWFQLLSVETWAFLLYTFKANMFKLFAFKDCSAAKN